MPWKCPACSTPIRHNELEATPRPDVVYRCHVCRLELVADKTSSTLVVAPLKADDSLPGGDDVTRPYPSSRR